ncbi:hypothetical protein [Streptomyces sp. WMMB 714]|uniref:hypothetical protein n=1 Tax=Streptomyces sp. WMMB 714 TaxID=1286822 RepID=UPI0005F779DA|nr:hypothetical protein [Streptomyces sp. WMMB 714]
MQSSRPRPRPRLRFTAAVSCAALLAVSAAACSAAEQLTTGMTVRNSVVKLGEQSAASVTVSVDGSPERARGFLEAARGKPVPQRDALRLSRAELTVAAGSGDEEVPLKEMPGSDAANVAAALNFGGKDIAAVKSVQDKLYLRVSLRSLVRQADGSAKARRTASEIVGLTDDLPSTLGAAKDALDGEWVRVDPEAFDDFARTAEMLAARALDNDREKNRTESKKKQAEDAERAEAERKSEQARRTREIRDAVTIGSALDGQSQREFVTGVQELLREHAEFSDRGEHDGAERVRLTLPGDKAADDLVSALKPLGAEIDPDRVPDRDVTADLDIRRGQLTTLTLDLDQFTGTGRSLPLRVEFSGGDAVPVAAPGGTKELEPQDLVAALMYGALGTEHF